MYRVPAAWPANFIVGRQRMLKLHLASTGALRLSRVVRNRPGNKEFSFTTTMTELQNFFRHGHWPGSSETLCGKGSSLAYTEKLRGALPLIFRRCKIKRLVDAPCGDFHWMKEVDLKGVEYIGMDIVPTIVAQNQEKYPGIRFQHGDITRDAIPCADLLMTRDCLFHLPFWAIADWMENVRRSQPRWLLVTSNTYPRNFEIEKPGSYRAVNLLEPPFEFSPPAPENIIRDYPDGAPERYMYLWPKEEYIKFMTPSIIQQVRNYKAPLKPRLRMTGEKGRRTSEDQESKDLGLAYYREMSSFGSLLDECIATSREKLGFFSNHLPRAYEYPIILEAVSKSIGPIIDLGAGLSPLPFILAERGRQVYTVDYSTLQRTLDTRHNWHEWGFFDYSTIDSRIQSFNVNFMNFTPPLHPIGCIYSTSVIEHMPADVRRACIEKISELLSVGGDFVTTIDLVPSTDALWNADRRKKVEPPEIHGGVGTLVNELGQARLGIERLEIRRGLPGSSTDILFLSAKKLY